MPETLRTYVIDHYVPATVVDASRINLLFPATVGGRYSTHCTDGEMEAESYELPAQGLSHLVNGLAQTRALAPGYRPWKAAACPGGGQAEGHPWEGLPVPCL